jgi:propanol-preferring alcohol dehydrogenase
MMRAVQYRAFGAGPSVVEVDVPSPGPGEVLIKIDAAGLCHTDLGIMAADSGSYPYAMPLTLGHEGVGTVVETGPGLGRVRVGDQVAVYGPWGCGRCATCATGAENYCPHVAAAGVRRPGLHGAGALADYMVVDREEHLVPLQGLDPVAAAGLTDAGLTSWHAIKPEVPDLSASSLVVVIGVGGLGHAGLQLLRTTSPSVLLAVDITQDKLDLAMHSGADHTLADTAELPSVARDLTGGIGATLVLDYVGSDQTLRAARESVKIGGAIKIVGAGGGVMPFGFGLAPLGARVQVPFWGALNELHEVLDLARAGRLVLETEVHPLAETPLAYSRLDRGEVRGRAVIVP